MSWEPPVPPVNILITGMTGSGKTAALLRILEGEYRYLFSNVVVICPTLLVNKTYQDWGYKNDPFIFFIPCRYHLIEETLMRASRIFKGTRTLLVIDDAAAGQEMKSRTSELVRLAFSARHVKLSVCVITQQLHSISKPFRENVSRLIAFYSPNKRDMKELSDSYLAGASKEEIEHIIDVLRHRRYSYLDIRLRHPVAWKLFPEENAETRSLEPMSG